MLLFKANYIALHSNILSVNALYGNQTNVFGMVSVMLHSLNYRTCRAAGATQPDTAQFEMIKFQFIVHLNNSASGNRNNSIYPISLHYLRVWTGHIS